MLRVFCNRRKGFKIIHINAQSLMPKIDEFRYLFENSKLDAICVSETWFSPDIRDVSYSIKGYRLFRSDRCGRAGGVAIYLREGLACKIRCSSSPGSPYEYLFLDVVGSESNLLLGTIYRPNRYVDIEPLYNLMEQMTVSSSDIIICGDFNENILIEESFSERMNSFDLHSVNSSVPTHFTQTSSTLLDLFLVSKNDQVLFYDQLAAPVFSRHDLIFLTFDFRTENCPKNPVIQFRDFKNVNRSLLEQHIRSLPWENIYLMPSPDDQVMFLNENIQNLFNIHVPLKTKKYINVSKPWFTNEIKELINQRDLAYRRWIRFRVEELHTAYKTLRNNVVQVIRAAKIQFYSNRLNVSSDGRKLWSSLRGLGIGKQRPALQNTIDGNELNHKFLSPLSTAPLREYCHSDELPAASIVPPFSFSRVNDLDVVESFLSVKSNAVGVDEANPIFLKAILPFLLPFFTHVFNTILTTGIFPQQWKLAKIIPIPKNSLCDEFRPISILPFLSKVCERIMQKQLNDYITRNKFLVGIQSGFRPKHSCTTALLKVIEDIRDELDDGCVTFLVLLDFSKAFDMVNHSLLLYKLRNRFNVSPEAIKLISSYISNRKQAVCLENRLSEFLPILRGVPQGSILAPLLFSLYINEIASIIPQVSKHFYADDIQIYKSCPLGLIENCVFTINEELDQISNWAANNSLTLNPTKCKCLVISKKMLDTSYFPSIMLNSIPLEFANTSKNLGMVFNRTLTWDTHINSIVGKAYGVLRTLWTVQQVTPLNTRIVLAKTLVIPVLTYGCEIFYNCDSASKAKLKLAFNSTIRYIYGLRKYDHVSHLSMNLLKMSFENFIKFRTLKLLFNVLITRQPPYLYENLRLPASSRSNCLILPRFSCLTSERQFFIAAIRLWNSLPTHLRELGSVQQFQSRLKLFFLDQSN